MSDEPKDNKVSEHSPEYGKKRITFYHSFEEMNEGDFEAAAKLTPQECLINLNQMLRKIFHEQLSKSSSRDNRLKFD